MTYNELDTTNATECESPSLQPEAGMRDKGNADAIGQTEVNEAVDEKFPREEIESAVSHDPFSVSERFVKHRSRSVVEAVLSTVAFSEGVSALTKNGVDLQLLLDTMVRVKAITKSDASEGFAGAKPSSRLSKWKKIAKYEKVLTNGYAE